MSFRLIIKKTVEDAPESVGQFLSAVPFTVRLGYGYVAAAHAIDGAGRLSVEMLESMLLDRLRGVLRFAFDKVPFYQQLYRTQRFNPEDVRSLKDWALVPVVTKSMLQDVTLGQRCAGGARGMKVNTGGTSGQPLEFLLDSEAFAREWAHMHYIWKLHGYSPRHLKLTFRGKHFDRSHPLKYNAVHNEYVVNSNCPMLQVVDAVSRLPRRNVIRWVHGYPSLVSEFACAIRERPGISVDFRQRLFGVLLGSEFPAAVYRDAIEQVLSSNIVTWYGHSEMAILARESARGIYQSLPTYGFAEALPESETAQCRLICTGLHNRAHPFIRYDTGDLVEPVSVHAAALEFRIGRGREGDFVLDRHGNRVSLTATIFGRHHRAFAICRHVQVRDYGNGRVVLLVVARDLNVQVEEIKSGFDLGDLDIDWDVELVDAPIRSMAGKILLKVKGNDH